MAGEARYKLVLVRHGESTWNQENKFCGWRDAELSEKGLKEALTGALALKEKGYEFDLAYTSRLQRAIKTLWIVLENTHQMWIPVVRSWRLNERHYGSLQGLNKSQTAEKHGEEQVAIWRRSYDTKPPALDKSDPTHPSHERMYADLKPEEIPDCECLKDTVERVLVLWNEEIAPAIKSGKRVIIAAHGNSLRSLVMYLDKMSESDIMALNLPTGIPLVYELDENLKPVKHYYLADEATLNSAVNAVANQGKVAK